MNIGKFFSDVEAFAPAILYAFNPAFGSVASGIVGLIKEAQASGQTGAQKADAVVAGTPALINDVNTAAGHVLVDPTLVETVLRDALAAIIATVKMVNNPTAIPAVTAALAPVAAPGAVVA